MVLLNETTPAHRLNGFGRKKPALMSDIQTYPGKMFRPPNALPFAGFFCEVVRSMINGLLEGRMLLKTFDLGGGRLTPGELQATRQ